MSDVFHFELRQSFHSARAFNLTEAELREKILRDWVSGEPMQWAEREWEPRKAKLTIISSRALRSDEMGIGRGWREAVRIGTDVTAQLLGAQGPARPESSFKPVLLALCAERPRSLAEMVRATGTLWPQARFSERVAIVEQAAWELLHQGTLRMELAGSASGALDAQRWQEHLLAPDSWLPGAELRLAIASEAGAPIGPAPGDGSTPGPG